MSWDQTFFWSFLYIMMFLEILITPNMCNCSKSETKSMKSFVICLPCVKVLYQSNCLCNSLLLTTLDGQRKLSVPDFVSQRWQHIHLYYPDQNLSSVLDTRCYARMSLSSRLNIVQVICLEQQTPLKRMATKDKYEEQKRKRTVLPSQQLISMVAI